MPQSPALAGPADPYREEYLYDDLGRLKQKTNLGADVEQREIFTYEAAGNRILKAVAGTFFLLEGDAGFESNSLEQIKITRAGDLDTAQRIDITLTDIAAVAGVDYLYWSATNAGVVYVTDGVALTLDFAPNETEKVIVLEGSANLTMGDSLSVDLSNPRDFNGATYIAATNTAIAISRLIYIAGAPDPAGPGPARFMFAGGVSVAEGTTAAVRLLRKGDTSTAHTLKVLDASGTAIGGIDYTAVNTTVAFAAGEITKTVPVTALADSASEYDEMTALFMTNITNGGILATPNDALVTIPGNLGPPATTIRAIDASIGEGGAAVVYFMRDGNLSTSQTISAFAYPGTATSSDSSSLSSGTTSVGSITFAAGQQFGSVRIPTTQDSLIEGNEYLWVWTNNVNSGSPGYSDLFARVTIIDDDGLPTPIPPTGDVEFTITGDTTVAEGDAALITIHRTGDTSSNHRVRVWHMTGSAQSYPGGSYEDFFFDEAGRWIYFGPGETSKTLEVVTLPDSVSEADEFFSIYIHEVTNGATIGSPEAVVVKIEGNLGPPASTLRVLNTSVREGGAAIVYFVRDGNVSSAQSVTAFSHPATATSADASSLTGTTVNLGAVSFSPGQRLQSISIPTTQDSLTEGNEYFWVWTNNVNAGAPGYSQQVARVTIVDDEGPAATIPAAPASFAFSSSTATVTEGTPGTVTIERTGGLSSKHTLTYYVQSGTARYGSDMFTNPVYATATNYGAGVLTFAPGETTKTILVESLMDSISEYDEQFVVALETVTNNAVIGANSFVTVTIPGDLGPPPAVSTLSVASASVTEGGQASIVITRSGDLSQNTGTIWWDTVAGSAGAADFTDISTSFAMVPNQSQVTLTVNTTQDTAVEGSEVLSVLLTPLSPPAGLRFSNQVGWLTILDNDTASSISIADVTVDEDEGVAALTLTRSGSATAIQQFVQFATSNDTAMGGSDYTAASGYVMFAPGATTATLNIPILDNGDAESSETFTVTLTANDPYTTLTDGIAAVTIIDDD